MNIVHTHERLIAEVERLIDREEESYRVSTEKGRGNLGVHAHKRALSNKRGYIAGMRTVLELIKEHANQEGFTDEDFSIIRTLQRKEDDLPIEIIKGWDSSGWITAIISNRWVQAKVYEEPSTYGVNHDVKNDIGRVSKLSISHTSNRNPNKNYLNQMCYNYSRGLDFDYAPEGLVDLVVNTLEDYARRELAKQE